MAPHQRRSVVATLLSFAWPGLGQAYRGDGPRALLFATPPLLLAVALGALALLVGPPVFVAYLLIPMYSLTGGLLVVAIAAWWAAAIIDAGRPHTRPSFAAAVLAIGLVVIGAGWSGSVVLSLYHAGEAIAQPIATPIPQPTASSSGDPSATPRVPVSPVATPTLSPAGPSASPVPSPLADERVTVLFVGADLRGPHTDNNTDTILVASYDPRTDHIAMISLPRDTGQLPLSDGRTWNFRINALMAYADEHPEEFPEGGMRTLQREVGHIIGIPIDYYAVVDFAGFEQLVDMVGGIDVVVDRPIADAGYGWWNEGQQQHGFYLEPGEHHLNGAEALAYARSRHGPGNSDFRRARRQQDVMLALRDRIDDPLVLANLPSIVDAAARMVRTDVPLDQVPQLVGLLQQSTGAEAVKHVLRPPIYAEVIPQSEIGRLYMTRLKMDAVAELSIRLFGDESRYAQEE